MYTASTRDLDSGLIFYENYVTIAFIWETDVQLFPGREPLELISLVKGTVADIVENCLIVENGGLGYEIYMTGQDLGKVRIGEEKKIHTFLYVREDILQLYGFFSKDDLSMFKLLIGVNGVGPKVALGILSGISADELRFAVLSDDVKTISKAPGIGKKTAQKMILELKDKLKLEDAFEIKLAHQQEEAAIDAADLRDSRQEAVEALVALGYSSADALRAVRKVPEDVPADDVEAILRAALKNFEPNQVNPLLQLRKAISSGWGLACIRSTSQRDGIHKHVAEWNINIRFTRNRTEHDRWKTGSLQRTLQKRIFLWKGI